MLYSDFLKQQQAVQDRRFSGNANMVKVKDSRFQSGYGWMPKGMADGTDHTKYYNAAQGWRAGGRRGKYTPPNLAAGETQGKISYASPRRSSSRSAITANLYRQAQEQQARALKKRQAMQQERKAAAAAKAQQAAQQRQKRAAQQGRQIGNFVHREGTSPSPSQSYYRPPTRGMAPGASMFHRAMMRGFRPPAQDNRRQSGGYGYGAMQTLPQRGSPSNMPAYQRRQRASDVNSPVNYFDRSRGLRGRAMRGIQRQARRS